MFSKRFIITFALYSLSLDNTSAKPFMDGLTACKKNDPKLNACLMNILKQAKPQLIKGNSELNLPLLDPVVIPSIPIHKTLQDITVTGELTNLTANGATSMSLKSFKVNLQEHTWDMVVNMPLITFVTDFNLNVTLKALLMPIFGKGECEGNISDSILRFHANTEVNDDRLKLNDVKIGLNLGDVDVRIVKTQNPALAQTVSHFFNTNKRLVLDLVTPIAEDAARDLLLHHGNRIMSTIRITDLLID